MKTIRLVVFVCSMAGLLYAEQSIFDSMKYQQEGASLRIYRGSVELPARGIWTTGEGDDFFFLVPPDEAYDQLSGRRMAEVEFEEQINRGRYPLSSLTWACRKYATEHENTGPAVVEDLDTNSYSYVVNRFNQSPWGTVSDADNADGPFCYLIPNAPFKFVEKETFVRDENREPLAFELRPYVGDGKHWVCYTDGQCSRVEIDQEMVARHGQEIRPIFAQEPQPENLPASFRYSILMSQPEGAMEGVQSFSIENMYTREKLDLAWDLSKAGPGDDSVARQLRDYQTGEWWCYLQFSDSPVLQTWMALAGEKPEEEPQWGRQRRGEDTSVFGVMGGYAAVRETLQMQLINAGNGESQERTVPIDSLEGVKVSSHPYAEMLGDKAGGNLSLAELAPHDRFFVYLAKPEAMLSFLAGGADFVSELGGTVTGNSIKYYLKARYLKRLGLNEEWLKLFLQSGGVKECALFAPDLFFLDGTDITVVSRMANARVIIPLLKMIGLPALSDQGIVEIPNGEGGKVYWTIRDNLLLVSTSAAELQLVLDLHAGTSEGSLGKSAEFRYMLTQLPLNDQTRCYAYCSDPFIRRLVGPATKIGQLRRVKAMNQMRLLSSGALLAQLDGFGKVQSLETLKARGCLPASFDETEGYSLDADLVAHSPTYGTLANLAPVGSVPVDMVTKEEEKAYSNYVRNYSRFWRQFFDPIALRLDDQSDGSLEAGIFILPLIDSSIYSRIKQFVMAREEGLPLKVPRFTPDPVLQFSVNLKEPAWRSVAEGMSEILTQYIQVDPAILDDLGPSVHVAINDGDPVVALGSGDLLGAFGGNSAGFGRNEEMFLVPIVLSVLTRPSTIAVETSQPEKTIMYLRNAADSISSKGSFGGDDLHSEIYKIEDRDSWVCLFNIMGMVQLRYGLEVKNGFLLIRNIPWSSEDEIETVENPALNGMGLKIYPAACKLQLPGLYATASEKERAAAFQGMGFLYPLVASGYASMETAFDRHMKLFGFTPRQADGDQWSWLNETIESKTYGSVFHKQQPAYDKSKEGFGMMGTIHDLDLQMQFEETGLRATISWKTRTE